MMSDALIYGIQLVIISAILFEMYARVRALRAVRGSFPRYKWMTIRRITSWGVIIGFFLQGLVYVSNGLYEGAGISVIVGMWSLWSELKYHHDDDDWFNGRWKKIKSGIANALRPRVTVAAPSFG
jgi:hypothetical protein